MNDIELDDFLKKIETGLQESRKQLLNEYALRNDSLVVGDDNGNVLEVPAKEILARHPELVCGNSMEYIDFTQKRIELHEEMENAIRSLMKENGILEIDLTEDEGVYGRAWVIRSNYDEGGLEEVEVTALKLEGEDLYYKGIGSEEEDEDWQSFDIKDTMVSCTIDSVYDAVYERLNKK